MLGRHEPIGIFEAVLIIYSYFIEKLNSIEHTSSPNHHTYYIIKSYKLYFQAPSQIVYTALYTQFHYATVSYIYFFPQLLCSPMTAFILTPYNLSHSSQSSFKTKT